MLIYGGFALALGVVLGTCEVFGSQNEQDGNGTVTVKEHFTIALLAPWKSSVNEFSALTSASAVSIAVEKIHSDPFLGNWMKFNVVTADTSCSSKISLGNMVALAIEYDIDAFIGPACSEACGPAAQLASYWNKPIISWVGTAPEFDSDLYTTLARTLSPFNKMGLFLVDVFEHYNWKRAVIIFYDQFPWLDAEEAISIVFEKNDIEIALTSDFDQFPTHAYMRDTLTEIKQEGRIVLMMIPLIYRRQFMLMAHELNMTKGDYVFYLIDLLPEEDPGLQGKASWVGRDGRDEQARQAFEAVFRVSLAGLIDKEITDFKADVARRMRLSPWKEYIDHSIDMSKYPNGDSYSPFLHDAVMLYAVVLNQTRNDGGDIRSGASVAHRMQSKTFNGITGSVILDQNGDREPNYVITDMAPNGSFIKIAEIINTYADQLVADQSNNTIRVFYKNINPPMWPGGRVGQQFAPPDLPVCGFNDELCTEDKVAGWIVAVTVTVIILSIVAISGLAVFLYRRNKYEADLLVQSWKAEWEEIELIRTPVNTLLTAHSSSSHSTTNNTGSNDDSLKPAGVSIPQQLGSVEDNATPSTSMAATTETASQSFSNIGLYKGTIVALKRTKKQNMQVTRDVLIEFNEMKYIVHENLNVFAGACIEPFKTCVLWHYCPKGSLVNVLGNDNYKLDTTFKLSFMIDLTSGMQYLHSSPIRSHGNLKDSNCLIDGRWTLKITDYGLPSFLSEQEDEDVEMYKRKLWTAPELLRQNYPPPKGTQEADVYSFAIIAYEIVLRTEPYLFTNITPRDVVNRVRNGESIPVRPLMPPRSESGKDILSLVRACWDENPDTRPNFPQIRNKLLKMSKGSDNILDNVLKMMEKHATNLEKIVKERTQQLLEEKEKTDRLLYKMLPTSVADQLKVNRFFEPECFDQATVFFSAIVGFTQLASESEPMEIVDFLNSLYSCFDDIIAHTDVYKVETIGDSYMVVSGVPLRNDSRHVTEIANISLELLSQATHFKIKHRPLQQLQLRIGIHTGAVVAGVVGLIRPRYCLFGDTVNMAARMETSGKALHIHTSKATFLNLKELSDDYEMTCRGETSVKGKGLQKTYWLHGKKGFDKPLPYFDP